VTPEVAAENDLARAPAAVMVAGRRRELDDRVVVVGRSRECDIAVDDPNVSRRHAEIRREDGAYWIVDLGSTNGVTVNGERVERARLDPDAEVLLGTTELRFERGY
jgi:pSer/pThr/pTyr-binding forkhead associated (FHA) protein